MFNSDMLEVAIGLVFVYLLFSFMATALREGLEAWLKQRGALLERGILGLLHEPTGAPASALAPSSGSQLTDAEAAARAEAVLEMLYRSAPIFGLFRGHYLCPSDRGKTAAKEAKASVRKLPSYIPAANFAEGVISVVRSYAREGAGGAPGSLDQLRLALEGVPNAQLRDVVRTGIKLSGGDPDRLRSYIEAWFDGAMDRVSGQYRRNTQVWVLAGSLLVAVAMNINTITIVQGLSTNGALRHAIADNAALVAKDQTLVGDQAGIDKQLDEVRKVGLPIGWGEQERDDLRRMAVQGPTVMLGKEARVVPLGAGLAALGWAMTALAISLGAPFWFDVLNKFMVVRSTVKPREKSGEEASKDGGDADASDSAKAGAVAPAAAPRPPVPVPAAAVSEADREEFGGLDPSERPREDD